MRYQKKLLDESQRVDAKLYTTDKSHSYLNSIKNFEDKNVKGTVKSADVNPTKSSMHFGFSIRLTEVTTIAKYSLTLMI